MSCEILDFSLSVVAVRHLCILTYTGPPRPQRGQEKYSIKIWIFQSIHVSDGPHLFYIRAVEIKQTQKFSLICVMVSKFSLWLYFSVTVKE